MRHNKFSDEARQQIKKGMEVMYNAVRITLGPRGRNVVIQDTKPVITNDGVTVAKSVKTDDAVESIGTELLKEVAEKTNDQAGDGTTTAVVLAYAMIEEGIKNVVAGSDPMSIKRGIDKATIQAIELLNTIKKPVKDEAEQVAIIAAEDIEMGKMIAGVIKEVGENGVVTVEESQTFGISKELTKGMQIDNGFISRFMVTDIERNEAIYRDIPVLITDQKIFANSDIVPLLQKMDEKSQRNLFVIAEDISGEALGTMFLSKAQGGFNVLGIKASSYGARKKDVLEDIALLTGAKFISEESGIKLDKVGLDVLGKADKVVSNDKKTLIIGNGDVSERIKLIKSQLKEATEDWMKNSLKDRLAKLTDGVAIIRVGAATEAEMKYKKFKIEDALNATRAAIEEGIVPGGGIALVKVSSMMDFKDLTDDERVGANIVKKALISPLRQIAENSGMKDISVIVNDVQNDKGFDFNKNESVDMMEAGIIDPLKVTRCALQNASSMAGIFLTMEAAICWDGDKSK